MGSWRTYDDKEEDPVGEGEPEIKALISACIAVHGRRALGTQDRLEETIVNSWCVDAVGERH